MEVKGTVKQKLEKKTGQGKNGTWTSQDIILEIPGQYPEKLVVNFFGDNSDQLDSYAVGDIVTVSISFKSKEYDKKWYNHLSCWKIESEAKNRNRKISRPN